MNARTWITMLVVAGAVAAWPTGVCGQTVCCTHCGNASAVRPVCRPVCTTRPVEVTSWDVVEEHVCTTGVCADACKLRPRNRLMRKTHVKQVPVVVWKVEYGCASCGLVDVSQDAVLRGDPGDLSLLFPPSPSSMSQWDGQGGIGDADKPRDRPHAFPLDRLIRAVRGYVQRQ